MVVGEYPHTFSKEIYHTQDGTYSELNDKGNIYQESSISSINIYNVLSDEIQRVTHSIQQKFLIYFQEEKKA